MGDVNAIVERLANVLGTPDGPPAPLEGGITNRNYRVSFAGREVVVRLPGKDTALLGISREAERVAADSAAGLGIAPAVLAGDAECLVTEYVPCRSMKPPEVAARAPEIGAALRLFHDRAAPLPARFWVPSLLDDYAAIVRERGGTLPAAYRSTQELARRIGEVLGLSDPAPCHNDLLPGNILGVAGDAVMLVDWEYAGMGHRFFDLGNVAVNNELSEAAGDRLLTGYFGEPPTDRRRAMLALMRIMSDAREAAWGVIQSVISELEFDFDSYACNHFGRLTRTANDPRLKDWLDAAST